MLQFTKKLFKTIAATTVALSVFVSTSAPLSAASEFEGQSLKVGVVGSTMKDIVNYVAEKAAKEGIKLEVVELSDYNTPNESLLDGSIDLNAFQHQVFLDDWNQSHQAELTNIGYTFAVPFRVYSGKHASLADLPDGAKIAISADPVGSTYAIKVLAEDAKLFTLKDGVGESPTVNDIKDNPKHIQLVELDASQIPTAMPDVDAGVIQDSFLKATTFKPTDAIYVYGNTAKTLNLKRVNIFASRKEDATNPLYLHIVELFQQPDTAEKIVEISEGGLIPAWDLVKEAQSLKDNSLESSASTESSSSN